MDVLVHAGNAPTSPAPPYAIGPMIRANPDTIGRPSLVSAAAIAKLAAACPDKNISEWSRSHRESRGRAESSPGYYRSRTGSARPEIPLPQTSNTGCKENDFSHVKRFTSQPRHSCDAAGSGKTGADNEWTRPAEEREIAHGVCRSSFRWRRFSCGSLADRPSKAAMATVANAG